MILHFIKRDFNDQKIFWILLAALTLLIVLARLPYGLSVIFLFYMYMIFGIMSLNGLTGAKLRTQHIMSRNYLLSLPISRRKLYLFIHIRAFVFLAPLFLLALITPVFLPEMIVRRLFHLPAYSYVYFPLLVMAGTVWLINAVIYAQVSMENFYSHLNRRQRFTKGLIKFFGGLIEVSLVMFSVQSTFMFKVNPAFSLLLLGLVASFRFLNARRIWLGK